MSHFMKLWERIIEARLREIVNIRHNQFGFRPGMSTTYKSEYLNDTHIKKNKLIPIFKNKGDILECNSYRGIKLMSHFMKLWERIIEARLR